MKRFKWMVYDKIDKLGIWFRDTVEGEYYVLYWNPIRTLYALINKTLYLGFFPLSTKHIKIHF